MAREPVGDAAAVRVAVMPVDEGVALGEGPSSSPHAEASAKSRAAAEAMQARLITSTLLQRGNSKAALQARMSGPKRKPELLRYNYVRLPCVASPSAPQAVSQREIKSRTGAILEAE